MSNSYFSADLARLHHQDAVRAAHASRAARADEPRDRITWRARLLERVRRVLHVSEQVRVRYVPVPTRLQLLATGETPGYQRWGSGTGLSGPTQRTAPHARRPTRGRL